MVDEQVIGLLEYDGSWPRGGGRSLQLDDQFEVLGSASQARYWCTSTTPLPDSEDRGTPGRPNALCPAVDHDGDGTAATEGDCDDSDPDIGPDAKEVWNGIDDNCDGLVDQSTLEDLESGHLLGETLDRLGFVAGLSYGDVDHDGDIELVVASTRSTGLQDGLVHTLDAGDASTWADRVGDVDEARNTADWAASSMGLVGRAMRDNTGDGQADLIIGGSAGRSGERSTVLLYAGSALTGDLEPADAQASFDGLTAAPDSSRVASHLDSDGDGVHEIIFGDPQASNRDEGVFAGGIYVIDASGASGSMDFDDGVERAWFGEAYGEVGTAVDGADLDGDGYDDLIVCGQAVRSYSGVCHVVFGGAVLAADGRLDERAGVSIYGTSTEQFGYAPRAALGDFDGNTDLDVAFGHPFQDEALVFLDLADRSGEYDTSDADVVITVPGGPGYFGHGLAAGDFDDDGVDDLAIGAPDSLDYSSVDEAGAVWVWSGLDVAGGATALDDRDAWASVTGGAVGDAFGQAILSADLQADGVPDLVISAPGASGDAGRVSIVLLD